MRVYYNDSEPFVAAWLVIATARGRRASSASGPVGRGKLGRAPRPLLAIGNSYVNAMPRGVVPMVCGPHPLLGPRRNPHRIEGPSGSRDRSARYYCRGDALPWCGHGRSHPSAVGADKRSALTWHCLPAGTRRNTATCCLGRPVVESASGRYGTGGRRPTSCRASSASGPCSGASSISGERVNPEAQGRTQRTGVVVTYRKIVTS